MPQGTKISNYADAGEPQSTDKLVIARAGNNFSLLWSSIITVISSAFGWIESGWIEVSQTWTLRTQAYTNDPAAGSSIVLNMINTAGFALGQAVTVSSSAGSETAYVTGLVANTSITVNFLSLNHTTTSPLVTLLHGFTISGDYSTNANYQPGIKTRWKNGGGYKYGLIRAVSVVSSITYITMVHTSDYTISGAITDTAVSKINKPDGYPKNFSFVSNLTASTTNPTGLTTTGKYTVNQWGIICFISSIAGGAPTNGSGFYLWSVPFVSSVSGVGPLHITDISFGRFTGSAYQSGINVIGITSNGLVTNASPIATLASTDSFDFSMMLLF